MLKDRKELLSKLINMEDELFKILEKLTTFGWDSKEELITLRKDHILNALTKYIDSKVEGNVLEDWANAIEGRDDIGIEETHKKLINQIIYELANPYLTMPLSKERAKILSKLLEDN